MIDQVEKKEKTGRPSKAEISDSGLTVYISKI